MKPKVFVLIHPAWRGAWFWKKVVPLLRENGHLVFTPTLSGLGERSHLARAEIGLGPSSGAIGSWRVPITRPSPCPIESRICCRNLRSDHAQFGGLEARDLASKWLPSRVRCRPAELPIPFSVGSSQLGSRAIPAHIEHHTVHRRKAGDCLVRLSLEQFIARLMMSENR